MSRYYSPEEIREAVLDAAWNAGSATGHSAWIDGYVDREEIVAAFLDGFNHRLAVLNERSKPEGRVEE